MRDTSISTIAKFAMFHTELQAHFDSIHRTDTYAQMEVIEMLAKLEHAISRLAKN